MTSFDPQAPSSSPGEEASVVVHVYALTDVGRTREHNEDTFMVADLGGTQQLSFEANRTVEARPSSHGMIFLVADGMGGAASGELASGMAGDTVLEVMGKQWSASTELGADAFVTALRDATANANDRIHLYAQENPEHRGMGTTATIAGLLNDHVYVAQVGDSRAYLVRNGRAIQLTKDQSLMQRLVEAGEITQEEAEVSDRRNIILQALGPEPTIAIDLTHQQLRTGDTLILCSDGLSGIVRGDEIARHSLQAANVSDLCHSLVNRANELGGPDNITVIAVRVSGNTLSASRDDDQVGHNIFPLEGTLSDEGTSASRSAFKSDPTPPFGYRRPQRSELEEEFNAAKEAESEQANTSDSHAETDSRKERVAPYMMLLLIAAVLAAIWTAWRLFRSE